MTIRRTVTTRRSSTTKFLLAPTVLRDVTPAPAPSLCYDDFRAFLADLEASTEYAGWCSAQPTDCANWVTYSHAILAGSTPAPPAMATIFGDSLVDAGIIALDGIVPCRAAHRIHAAFSFAVSGLDVVFTNLSTPGPSGTYDSWLWVFGDGDTDDVSWHTAHTYAIPGTYPVTLTVVGSGADGSSSTRHLVTVSVPGSSGVHIDAVIL